MVKDCYGKYKNLATKVTRNTIIINFILAIFKIISGIISNSVAIISDGIHTASDVISTLIVIIGYRFSLKKPDEKHQYGHERIECISAIILSIILLFTGISIGKSAIIKIFNFNPLTYCIPGILSIIAAIISIFTQEILYFYVRSTAKKINSVALLSNAWHHHSDALSSVGSLLGVIFSRLGFYAGDFIAGLVICIIIIKMSIEIFVEAVKRVIDESCDKKLLDLFIKTILNNEDVILIDKIRTRKFGNRLYVDIEITLDGDISFKKAHGVAHAVSDSIENNFSIVKQCMIHVNPSNQ